MNKIQKSLEELQSGKTSRVFRSLAKLNELLESLFFEGNRNFSISHIGRLSKASGGISEISIRNKTGVHYRELIEYWENKSEQESNKNPVTDLKKNSDKEIEIVTKNVENIAARNFIYTIIAERNKLRKIVKTQEKIIKTTVVITAKDLGNDVPNLTQKERKFHLDQMEFNTLKDTIEFDYNIVRKFWEIMEDGSVLDENGDQIYKIGYIDVIKKILEFIEDN